MRGHAAITRRVYKLATLTSRTSSFACGGLSYRFRYSDPLAPFLSCCARGFVFTPCLWIDSFVAWCLLAAGGPTTIKFYGITQGAASVSALGHAGPREKACYESTVGEQALSSSQQSSTRCTCFFEFSVDDEGMVTRRFTGGETARARLATAAFLL